MKELEEKQILSLADKMKKSLALKISVFIRILEIPI